MSGLQAEIVLVGGGHAHVAVLADWATNGLPAKRALLLTPEPTLRYSGMVPGWLSGEHSRDSGLVDLVSLGTAAGVEVVLDRCVALDPQARSILTRDHGLISFDIASIDVGGAPRAAKVLGDDPRLIDVRPITTFVDRLAETLAQPLTRPLRIAVIGGGAAGFELAFALRNTKLASLPPEISVFLGRGGPLPNLHVNPARAALKELRAQGMHYIKGEARLDNGQLKVWEHNCEPQDLIVAAIGSGAPDWQRMSGLDVDAEGFILVDRYQRSISHQHIFASGDCARRSDTDVPHAGVHAVHTGPVLAANLRAVLGNRVPTQSYIPRRYSLYLLSTGRGEAIASYGPLTAKGRWVSKLKAWIDKRWIASYAAIGERA